MATLELKRLHARWLRWWEAAPNLAVHVDPALGRVPVALSVEHAVARLGQLGGLNAVERSFAEGLLLNRSNSELADSFNMPLRTVKYYVHRVVEKCGAGNRGGLWAVLLRDAEGGPGLSAALQELGEEDEEPTPSRAV